MNDTYSDKDGETIQAIRLDAELVIVASVWCGGRVVEEIDPVDGTRYPAINLETREGVSRASLGDYVIKHGDGTFEVKKPGSFAEGYLPKD